jgi:glycerol-3-phosphate dehydrogenase
MAGDRTFTIHPRKGTDIIMDKSAFKHLSKTGITLFNLFDTLRNHTKGGGVIPTIDCNSLIGPDAVETPLREDYSVSRESIDKIFNKQKGAIPTLSERDIIAYFSGTRASTYEEDFVVRKGRWTKNILEAAGIQSPGLTAAPAIAEDLRRMAYEELGQPEKKKDWDGKRKAPINTKKLSPEEWDDLIKKDPSYGHIVCRCEEISEGEIRAALRGKLKATTIDGVKRRVRAGMGRCQGGFCQPLVSQYIAEELNQNILETKKKGEGKILYRETKEDEQ